MVGHGQKNMAGNRKKSNRSGDSVAYLQKLFDKAQRHISNGNFHRATPLLLKIKKSTPDSPEVLQSLGIIALETDEPSQAINYLQQAVQIAPDLAEIWNLLGGALNADGHMTNAIEALERAVSLKPNYAKAHFNLAMILFHGRMIDKADYHFKQALAGMLGDFDAHITYADFLIKHAAHQEALKVLEHAHGLVPGNSWANFLSGTACAGLGMLKEALEYFYTALKLLPDEPETYKEIGVILKAMETLPTTTARTQRDELEKIRSLAPLSPEPDILDYWLGCFSASHSGDSLKLATRKFPLPQDEAVKIETPSRNYESETKHPETSENIVALLHWGRSGSGFFHSLVDGHPQVSTLPGHYLASFFSQDMWSIISSSRIDEMIGRFVDHFEVLFDAAAKSPPGFGPVTHIGINEGYTTMGESKDQTLHLDRKAFAQNLNALLAGRNRIDRGTFFRSVHKAYEQTLGRSAHQTNIFYHIHSPDNYGLLNYLMHFPQSKILMTVREPIQNLESWVSSAIDEAQSYKRIIDRIVGFLIAFDKSVFRDHPSRGIRLEDLKFETVKTMDALCQWLEIKNDPALEHPTFQGLKWWGDPSTKRFGRTQPVIGFAKDEFDSDTDPIMRKVGYFFSERDQFILETLLYPVRVLYGYIEPHKVTFERDLKTVRPMLAEPFDFEHKISNGLILGKIDLERNASSKYLRNVLRDRWETLNAVGTYSNMIPPLLSGLDEA